MDETKPSRKFYIGKKEDLARAKRTHVTLEGRDILLLHHRGSFYALDLQCYHAGTALLTGDIEEIGGRLCVVCPKHKYKLTLAEGECLYKASERWLSKGVKQRTHTVLEVDQDVFLTLSRQPGWVESDYYQSEKGREELRNKKESDEEAKDADAAGEE